MAENEYGAKLDRNGYAPSILQTDFEHCFLCFGSAERRDRHEVFGGAYREKSKRLGLWVSICHNQCHIFGPFAVHNNNLVAQQLKQEAQRAAMAAYGWDAERFIREFGRNYIDAE